MIRGVVPAAGRALRLQPLAGSKELVDVGGRPVMDYLVERMRAAGADELVVVTRPDKGDVADHAARLGARVALGTPATVAESLLLGIDGARADDRVLLGFPDTVWDPLDGFARLLALLDEATDVALGVFQSREPERSDVVLLDGDRVTAVEVKPAEPRSALVWGCAAARASALGSLSHHHEPGFLFAELAPGGRVAGLRFGGEMIDVGTPDALERARRAVG